MKVITCKQLDVDDIYTYFETLATHSVSPSLFLPSNLREMLEDIKEAWPYILS